MSMRKIKNDGRTEQLEKLKNALVGDDVEAVVKAHTEFAETIKDEILSEAELYKGMTEDEQILNNRGLHKLTSAEREYYNEVITKNTFDGIEKTMPVTVFDRVFEDLRQNHPVLSKVDFVNVTGVTEWVIRTNDVEMAWWGKLCDKIKKQLETAFDTERMDQYKLSAFVPLCKSMLKLGPIWLDRLVREILAESMSMASEKAIIDGTGNEQPIGLTKDLDGAVTGGVYADKTAVALKDFKPATLGKEVMKPLVAGKITPVGRIQLLVNPNDYWGTLFGVLTKETPEGNFIYDHLPINAEIVQSVYVPDGKLIACELKDYFMGIGSNSRIEHSDEYRFLEDDRVYISKMLANGRPKNNKAIVFDISAIATPTV